jgi:putative oxidoreductase
MYKGFVKKHSEHLYVVFRVFVGLLFFQHGAQKLLGWFGGVNGAGGTVELVSLFGLAGLIELTAGLAIALGLLTRVAASIAALEMLGAYYMAHLPNGLVPISNQGELALLYFASFLVIVAHGAKKWNLDSTLFKKELF